MAGEGLFQTAPREVVEYFDRRPNRPTFSWRDIAPREHATAFTVAKSAGFDILGDVRAAVRGAVVDRLPFDAFRAGLEPKLRAAGWWGERRLVDPATGQPVKAQLGSLRRLRLIYDANIRSAEAAGDWSRIRQTKRVLPYLEYLTSVSERKRPQHLAWVGTTLPADDPWWATHFPPNGWNCKCRVSQRDQPRDGTRPEQMRRPPLDLQPWTNRRTGETEMVPAGIDPGWQHNPGREREKLAGQRLVERLDAMREPEARREAVRRIRQEPLFRYVSENGAGFPYADRERPEFTALGRMRVPAAVLSDQLRQTLDVKTSVATLSVADAAKIRLKHPEIDAAAWTERLDRIIVEPDLIEPGDKMSVWKTLDGVVWKVILKRTSIGEVFVNSFYRARQRALADAMRRSG